MNLSKLGKRQKEILRHLVSDGVLKEIYDYRDCSTQYIIEWDNGANSFSISFVQFIALIERKLFLNRTAPSSLEVEVTERYLKPEAKQYLQENYLTWLD